MLSQINIEKIMKITVMIWIGLIIILFFILQDVFTVPSNLKLNQYIVLKCIIPNEDDLGGFAWQLHHAQALFHICQETGKIPIIYFNNGYYHSPKHGDNWWNYFFKPIQSNKLVKKIINYGNSYGYEIINQWPLVDTNKPYLYNNGTFQNIIRYDMQIKWNEMYKYIQLNDKMNNKINQFMKENFKPLMIGIHYRGTDKFASYGGTEDMKENKHLNYETVISKIKEFIQNHFKTSKEEYGLFIASDEQPFVDRMTTEFPKLVVSYSSFRSQLNTSGLELPNSKKNENEQLRQIQKQSIHRGHQHISPYKKGEDAVMDIWLLSNCKYFFRTHGGNFSSQPERINPKLIVTKIE